MRYRSPSGRFITWDRMLADARSAPGVWLLAFPNSPVSLAYDINARRPVALLHATGGHLAVEPRNRYRHPNTGTMYADIYVRWMEST